MNKTFSICMLLIATAYCGPSQSQDPSSLCVPSLPSGQERFVSRHCGHLRPRRIVIVTTHNRQDRLKEQDLFARSLAKHLRNGQFEVVICHERMCRRNLPMQRGVFDEHELLALSGQYNVDSVLYCEINEISAYEPMQLQMSMLLVNVGEAVSLVAANATLDLRDANTHQGYVHFAGQACEHFATDTSLSSPSLFIDFASAQFVGGLLPIWAPSPSIRVGQSLRD